MALLIIFSLIFSVGIGSLSLFDLDELYFAEITREMMLTGNYGQVTFHFKPLYEKPPLFFWIQAASMHFWGVNELGARFPNVLCGLLTLLTLYYIGTKYQNNTFGLLWMSLYASSFLPHFYFKTGIIDPWLNYFLLLSLYFLSFIATTNHSSWHGSVGAGLCIGLALLIKGPIGVLIPIATVMLSYTWFRGRTISLRKLLVVLGVATLLCSCWLIPEVYHNGYTFIKKFWAYHLLLYQQPVATHNQPWYYHYLILFLGCFPSSLFAIAFFKNRRLLQGHYWAANMQAVGVVVLFIFTLVGTKIVHYSSMVYFPITFFATVFLYQLMEQKKPISQWILKWFIGIGMAIGLFWAMIPWIMQHKELFIQLIQNKELLTALAIPVVWNYWDSLSGLFYIIGIWIAFRYLLQLHYIAFIRTVLCINVFSLTLFLIPVASKIACYTQKEVIDFCKAYKGKDVYMVTLGFKAAAPHFYTEKSVQNGLKEADLAWLLTGPIDKPCFFILYKSDALLLEPYKDIVCIQANPGSFAFYKRLPPVYANIKCIN